MPIKDIWLRVYEKWSKKGMDRSYAAWMADQAEKRYARKRQRGEKGIAMDQCEYCVFFIDRSHTSHESASGRIIPLPSRCVLHGADDKILPTGWCEYFRRGEADGKPRSVRLRSGHLIEIKGRLPLNIVNKKQSGYVDDARASMKGHDWRKRER